MTKKTFFLLGFLLCLGFPLLAQSGRVQESLVMKSKLLNASVRYTVYLPADYERSQRRYPVVYLLHGGGDDETSWVQYGEIQTTADRAIADGTIPPMIIVMPDAQRTSYVNDHEGRVRYEDMFIQEFVPFIDGTYRTRPRKQYRGLAGLSMGGYGSLVLSMHHPDLFAACAAMSAAVRSDEQIMALDSAGYESRYGHLYGHNLRKEARLTAAYRKNSILDLAKTMPVGELQKVSYYLDCGDDDRLTEGNALLHVQLTRAGVPHEYRVRDGAHTWTYWRTGILDCLRFIGKSFHQ